MEGVSAAMIRSCQTIAAVRSGTLRLVRSVASLSALGDNFGAMMADIVQPPLKERMDTLLLRLGLIESRKMARPFLKEYEVIAASQQGRKPDLVTSGSTSVDSMSILVDGAPIDRPGPLHLVMNKLPGLVCSHSHLEGPTIYGTLSEEVLLRNPTVNSIGRLDRLASGLLLLTQSGALIQRLTGEKTHLARTYSVRLQNPLSSDGREAGLFATGTLQLVDGHQCKPAVLERHPVDSTAARLTVFEGSHRLVRRMFSAVGNRVLALHRTHFGPLDLQSINLLPGQWRHLEPLELKQLLQASARPTKHQMRLLQRHQLAASREAALPSVPAHLLHAVETVLPRLLDPADELARLAPGTADAATHGGVVPKPVMPHARRLTQREREEAEMERAAAAEEQALVRAGELCGLALPPETVLSLCEASPSFHATLKRATNRGTARPDKADAALVRSLVETRAEMALRRGLPGAEKLAREAGVLRPRRDEPSREGPHQAAAHWNHASIWDDVSDDADGVRSDKQQTEWADEEEPRQRSSKAVSPSRARAARTVPARLQLRPTAGAMMQRVVRTAEPRAVTAASARTPGTESQARGRGRRRREIVPAPGPPEEQELLAASRPREQGRRQRKPATAAARQPQPHPPQRPISLREFGRQRAQARAARAGEGTRV